MFFIITITIMVNIFYKCFVVTTIDSCYINITLQNIYCKTIYVYM